MVRIILISLFVAYFLYSFSVYAWGTESKDPASPEALKGMEIWQSQNCQACHQIYGLGGYMGPDLTNIISDKNKGAGYAAVFIKNGTSRMPQFNLSDKEVFELIAFLRWIDKSGRSVVDPIQVNAWGNYTLQSK